MDLLKKLSLKVGLILLLGLTITSTNWAQERGNEEPRTSPNATVSQTIGTTDITFTYGRPAVNNREIFGELVPYGDVWRTGANESTALVVSKDVTIEGNKLKAGTYSLYTIPGKDKWTIIINTKLSWGTQYNKSKDLFRFTVEPQKADYRERMMFYFEEVTNKKATVVLHWDETKVPFTIKV
ncbi:DUF2911 domain-containing protein [Fodinibius halophilus]|uniref:DUF2911 domain-containing protein n=1 Tax=Fodinibius halophilus TaxID=1736908 RepID=A0A6M1T0E5_9BACT|nr:DUF2911 domain-containing protein [Fodinibius halophilus]NGP88956.1 DUF2911 domain-containing protein [Fodinibius halophilus]